MGLCKCPKKKVTNLFCFEHRVNVCESCLVESHASCVVQSYLAWLTDSDFDANCSLCANGLHERETVRLQCLHLFHWDCLDTWARRFPATTAPAGYRCPQCREALFPPANHTSPTIEQLRHTLQRANWARAALGLTLDGMDVPPHPMVPPGGWSGHASAQTMPGRSATPTIVQFDEGGYGPGTGAHREANQFLARKQQMDGDYGSSAMMPLLNNGTPMGGRGRDEDLPENKYKRRSAVEWFQRWLRSRYVRRPGTLSDPMRNCKRWFFLTLMIILGLATIITIMTRIVAGPSEDDPLLDPMANPNIRVAAMPGGGMGDAMKEKFAND